MAAQCNVCVNEFKKPEYFMSFGSFRKLIVILETQSPNLPPEETYLPLGAHLWRSMFSSLRIPWHFLILKITQCLENYSIIAVMLPVKDP